jgi:tetrahydromethanopterin S-methyltransferase subunit G
MEAMRKSWTDDRLDHFAERVDWRFDEVDRRLEEVDRRFDKVDVELHRINDRLDDLGKTMYYAAFTMTGGILAGFAAMTTLVLTQT